VSAERKKALKAVEDFAGNIAVNQVVSPVLCFCSASTAAALSIGQ
jgi:hypothetical protein